MIRDVKLIDYLPMFVREYREIREIMKTENPEFQKAEDETEIIFNNQFIKSCNQDGISRFEDLMGITPEINDTLESRISRVLTRWNDNVPYTFIVLCQKLDTLCGKENYTIIRDINKYKMNILTHLELTGQVEELDYILDYMIPANIELTANNKIELNINDGTVKLANGITFTNLIELSDNYNETFNINNTSKMVGNISDTNIIGLSDNCKEDIPIYNNSNIGANVENTILIELNDNSKEEINLNSNNKISSNLNLTEII